MSNVVDDSVDGTRDARRTSDCFWLSGSVRLRSGSRRFRVDRRYVVQIGAYEEFLVIEGRVLVGTTRPRFSFIRVIVAPLCEVITELLATRVCRSVLKVNDNKLTMGVLWKK